MFITFLQGEAQHREAGLSAHSLLSTRWEIETEDSE